MVVLLPDDPSSLSQPPLYGVLYHDGDPIATLRCEQYGWWSLDSTCIHSVVSIVHKHLEGNWFQSFRAAAQRTLQCICGVHGNYLTDTKIHVRGDVPAIIFGDEHIHRRVHAIEPVAAAHFHARVQCLPEEVRGGRYIPLVKAQPFIPHHLTRDAALNPSVWASHTPSTKSATEDALEETGRKRGGTEREDVTSAGNKQKRKRPRKPCIDIGAIVWDGRATDTPPVALIVKEVEKDPGDATRPCSTTLLVETLETPARVLKRFTRQVSSFDEQLLFIYRERRPVLEALGRWDETVAVIERGLKHRLLSASHLTMSELWTRRLAMGDEPCPVSDEAAAHWLSSHHASAGHNEVTENKAPVGGSSIDDALRL